MLCGRVCEGGGSSKEGASRSVSREEGGRCYVGECVRVEEVAKRVRAGASAGRRVEGVMWESV